MEYMKKHGLFAVALSAFKNDPVKYKVCFRVLYDVLWADAVRQVILTANAEYLMVKHDYVEAGLCASFFNLSLR